MFPGSSWNALQLERLFAAPKRALDFNVSALPERSSEISELAENQNRCHSVRDSHSFCRSPESEWVRTPGQRDGFSRRSGPHCLCSFKRRLRHLCRQLGGKSKSRVVGSTFIVPGRYLSASIISVGTCSAARTCSNGAVAPSMILRSILCRRVRQTSTLRLCRT